MTDFVPDEMLTFELSRGHKEVFLFKNENSNFFFIIFFFSIHKGIY
jgi:hypothetical protein